MQTVRIDLSFAKLPVDQPRNLQACTVSIYTKVPNTKKGERDLKEAKKEGNSMLKEWFDQMKSGLSSSTPRLIKVSSSPAASFSGRLLAS